MQLRHYCTFDPHGRTMYTIVYCCDLVRSKFPFCMDYFSAEGPRCDISQKYCRSYFSTVHCIRDIRVSPDDFSTYLANFRVARYTFLKRNEFFTYTDGWTSVIIDEIVKRRPPGIFIASCPLTTRAADTYTCICTCTWPVSRDAWRERSRSTRNLAHSERNIPSGALKTTGT